MENKEDEKGLQSYKTFLNSDGVKEKFKEMLGNRAPQFITSVMQIVSSNKDLSKADLHSIYNAAATAAILDLPLNNNLQFAHIIPYKDTKSGIIYAQFQMGWRGFVQLAQRSSKFSTINVTDVREGELKNRDRLLGECTFDWNQDEQEREAKKVIGFVSYFKLVNGFEKAIYWPVEKLHAHAAKYSKTYQRADSKWNTDFFAMCAKTLIKELLSKWAPLSIDMAKAIQYDQAIIHDDKVEYLDNPIQEAEELSEEEAADIERKAREDQAKQGMSDIEKTLFDKEKNKK